ncbi:MAG: TIGR04211 family SH3 domain-containing protein [Proteobacteria bacterium]|nr:TIGR04211 family SH3 domain-containing protein [Pseudomonadota bacterium]MDA0993175.1 TIGR04211 family SH3 domain-containing protein [Pseudomonadota bacterium]
MRHAFLWLIFLPLTAAAETAYITDNLRLGLHLAADTSDRAFRTLESGQELEIVSRDRNYASVRLPDGVEGYVKVAYLVFDKPAKLIVAETQSTVDRLQSELAETKAAFAEPSATIETLRRELEVSVSTAEASAAEVAKLSSELVDCRGRQDAYKYSLPYMWVGGAMLLCLLGGFVFGIWWIDQRIRRRHGGVRVY